MRVCVCRLNVLLLLPASSKAFRTAKLARTHHGVADALRQNAAATLKARLADDKAAAAKEKYLKVYD